MANEQPIAGVDVAALIARATIVKDGSIAALRDEARDHGRMPFKVRDMHVMALHNTYRELFAALDALTREQAEQQATIKAMSERTERHCNMLVSRDDRIEKLQAEVTRLTQALDAKERG